MIAATAGVPRTFRTSGRCRECFLDGIICEFALTTDVRLCRPFESQDFPAGERPAVPSAGKGDRKERATVNEEDEAATSEVSR